MIKFKRVETKVIIEIEHGIFHDNGFFEREIEQGYKYQAELLMQAFQKNLNDNLTRLKEKYYSEGYKNAKAKTKKRTIFYGGWEK